MIGGPRIADHPMKTTIAVLFFITSVFGQSQIPKVLSNYKIAYNVLLDKAKDDYEIFVMNADGSGKKNITNREGVDWVYTSFGKRIYFVSDRDTTYRKYFLYEMDADGNNVRRIGKFPVADSWQGVRKNGTEFVVSSNKEQRRNELYLIDRNGNEVRRLTNDTLYDNDPIFSPDGEQIVFRSKRGTKHDELWIMRTDGSNLHRLTRYPEEDTTAFIHSYHAGPPFWEPNNNFISYISNQQGRSSIFLIAPDGSGGRRFTADTTMNEGWHSWSHDGLYLAVECSDRENKKFSIFLFNNKGKMVKQLTNEHQFEQGPVFVRVP